MKRCPACGNNFAHRGLYCWLCHQRQEKQDHHLDVQTTSLFGFLLWAAMGGGLIYLLGWLFS